MTAARLAPAPFLLIFALASPAAAQDADALGALERTLERQAEALAPSLVLIHCQRPSSADRSLTRNEKRRLGLLAEDDKGYFKRPAGPCAGVVIDDKGTIITARYNLAGASGPLWVVGADGRRRAARLLGGDPNLDIQALAVKDHRGLAPVKPAAAAPRPGSLVALLARSEGAGVSLSFGMVSALGRRRGQAFQFSARMNYGNLGGAVVDLRGGFLGLGSFLSHEATTGQNSGVAFAAPAALILKSLPRLLSGKDAPRMKSPFLGIVADAVEGGGVRIGRVVAGTAAEKARLAAGDIIRIFNGVEVRDLETLIEEIDTLAVGDTVIVSIERGGRAVDVTVVVGGRSDEDD